MPRTCGRCSDRTPIIESRASVAAVGEPRVLRLAAVLAGERAARAAGGGARRLAASGLSVGCRHAGGGVRPGPPPAAAAPPQAGRRPSAPFSFDDPARRGPRHPRHPRDLQLLRHQLGRHLRREEVDARAVAREGRAPARSWGCRSSSRSRRRGRSSATRWCSRCRASRAYRFSVENSIYLGQAAAGKGLGRALLEALIAACEQAGIREMVAVISDKGAEASVALHEKLGFVEVGRMGRVGFKFGRWLGTIYLQKHLKPAKKRRACSGADQRARLRRRCGPSAPRAPRRSARATDPAPRGRPAPPRRAASPQRASTCHTNRSAPVGRYRSRRIGGIPRASVDQGDPVRRLPRCSGCARQRCAASAGDTRRCGVTRRPRSRRADRARTRRAAVARGRQASVADPSSSTPTPVQPARTASTSSDPSPYSASAAARVALREAREVRRRRERCPR